MKGNLVKIKELGVLISEGWKWPSGSSHLVHPSGLYVYDIVELAGICNHVLLLLDEWRERFDKSGPKLCTIMTRDGRRTAITEDMVCGYMSRVFVSGVAQGVDNVTKIRHFFERSQ